MANLVNKVKNFFVESYDELIHKVTWLKYSTLQRQTTLVLVASLIFALIIGLVIDNSLEGILGLWYKSNAPRTTTTP